MGDSIHVETLASLFPGLEGRMQLVRVMLALRMPELRDLGQMVCEIGLAPVKPAEFVIFRISQWAGPNAEA